MIERNHLQLLNSPADPPGHDGFKLTGTAREGRGLVRVWLRRGEPWNRYLDPRLRSAQWDVRASRRDDSAFMVIPEFTIDDLDGLSEDYAFEADADRLAQLAPNGDPVHDRVLAWAKAAIGAPADAPVTTPAPATPRALPAPPPEGSRPGPAPDVPNVTPRPADPLPNAGRSVTPESAKPGPAAPVMKVEPPSKPATSPTPPAPAKADEAKTEAAPEPAAVPQTPAVEAAKTEPEAPTGSQAEPMDEAPAPEEPVGGSQTAAMSPVPDDDEPTGQHTAAMSPITDEHGGSQTAALSPVTEPAPASSTAALSPVTGPQRAKTDLLAPLPGPKSEDGWGEAEDAARRVSGDFAAVPDDGDED